MKAQAIEPKLKQDYKLYTSEDFQVWELLFERQMKALNELAAKEYLEGIRIIEFYAGRIPDFIEVNTILKNTTGWSVEAVEGIIEKEDFLRMLEQKTFPATTWLRKLSELDYLPEPDMFHDVFAHLPLLTNQRFCDFFRAIGELGMQYKDFPHILTKIERLYWFTVEFGLIEQDGRLKIYGAGILSSFGETFFSVGETPRHLPFDVEIMMNTPFENDKIQDTYFVIQSFDELYNSIDLIREVVKRDCMNC